MSSTSQRGYYHHHYENNRGNSVTGGNDDNNHSNDLNEHLIQESYFVHHGELDNSFTLDYFGGANEGRITTRELQEYQGRTEAPLREVDNVYNSPRKIFMNPHSRRSLSPGKRSDSVLNNNNFNESGKFVSLENWGNAPPIGTTESFSPSSSPRHFGLDRGQTMGAWSTMSQEKVDDPQKDDPSHDPLFRSSLRHGAPGIESHIRKEDLDHSMVERQRQVSFAAARTVYRHPSHGSRTGHYSASPSRWGDLESSFSSSLLGKLALVKMDPSMMPPPDELLMMTQQDAQTKEEQENEESLVMVGITLLYTLFVGIEASTQITQTSLSVQQYFTTTWLINSGIYALFSSVYLIEMILKCRRLSVRRYFSSFRHQAEFFFLCCFMLGNILALGVVPFIYSNDGVLSIIIVFISLLRALVVLRLLQAIKLLEVVIKALSASLRALIVTAIFLVLFIFIFANLATRTLAETTDELMQELWGSFGNSMYTLFMIVTLDGIFDFVSETIRAHEMSQRPWVALFFVIFIVSTSILWLNVVTGVIVDSYLHATYNYRQERDCAAALASREHTSSVLGSIFYNDDIDADAISTRDNSLLMDTDSDDNKGNGDDHTDDSGSMNEGDAEQEGDGNRSRIVYQKRSRRSMKSGGLSGLKSPPSELRNGKNRRSTTTDADQQQSDPINRVILLKGRSAWELLMEPVWRKAIKGAQVPEHKAFDVLQILVDFGIESVTVKEFAEACLMVGGKSTGRDLLIAQLEQRVGHETMDERVQNLNGVMERTKTNIDKILKDQRKTVALETSTSTPHLPPMESTMTDTKSAIRRQKTHPAPREKDFRKKASREEFESTLKSLRGKRGRESPDNNNAGADDNTKSTDAPSLFSPPGSLATLDRNSSALERKPKKVFFKLKSSQQPSRRFWLPSRSSNIGASSSNETEQLDINEIPAPMHQMSSWSKPHNYETQKPRDSTTLSLFI